jgi:hypothetical protein
VQVTQEVRVVEEYDKKRALYEVLEKCMDGSKVLIFTSTKRTADDLTHSLRADGFPARAIHGDKVRLAHTSQPCSLPLLPALSPLSPVVFVSIRVSRSVIGCWPSSALVRRL